MGCPPLYEPAWKYESASQYEVPVIGTFIAKATALGTKSKHDIRFIVSDVSDLNLLGRTAKKEVHKSNQPCNAVFSHLKADTQLRAKCRLLCNQFPDLWKSELGCLTDFKLDIKFKGNSQPIFGKARPVPVLDSLFSCSAQCIVNPVVKRDLHFLALPYAFALQTVCNMTSVMADKGFSIENTLLPYVRLNIPPVTKEKGSLIFEEERQKRCIACQGAC